MTEQQVQVWSGVIAAGIVSVAVVGGVALMLFRKRAPAPQTLIVLAVLLVGCVSLVGSAPWVATIQSLLVTMGLLAAILHYVISQQQHKGPTLSVLVGALLVTLLLSGASRKFNIGLQKWFGMEVEPAVASTDWKDIPGRPADLDELLLAMRQRKQEVATTWDNLPGKPSDADAILASIRSPKETLTWSTLSGKPDDVDSLLSSWRRAESSLGKTLDKFAARIQALEADRSAPKGPAFNSDRPKSESFSRLTADFDINEYGKMMPVEGTPFEIISEYIPFEKGNFFSDTLEGVRFRVRHKVSRTVYSLTINKLGQSEDLALEDDERTPLLLRVSLDEFSSAALKAKGIVLRRN